LFQRKKFKVPLWIILIEFLLLVSLVFITVHLYTDYTNTNKILANIINHLHNAATTISLKFKELMIICIDFYTKIDDIFTNRELALGFWLIVVIFYIIWKIDMGPLKSLGKSILNKKILILLISYIIYFLILIFILDYIGFWESRLWKVALIWSIFAGISVSFRAIMKANNISYFVALIKDNVKIFLLIQFTVNLYSFSLLLEIAIVFIIAFLTILKVFLETSKDFQDENSKILKNTTNVILGIIGLFLLLNSLINYFEDLENISYIDKIKDLLLPSMLSMMFIPYIYFFVLYSHYEQLFIRLSFKKTINDNIRRYLYLKILLFCNIDIKKINTFIQGSKIMTTKVQSKYDVRRLLTNYKNTLNK
jgi:hypothetical protein